MVRDEIDEDLEIVVVATGNERLKFFDAMRRISCEIRAYIEIIANGIWAARDAFEDIWGIGRAVWVMGAAGMFDDAGEPEVRDAHFLDCGEGCVVEI